MKIQRTTQIIQDSVWTNHVVITTSETLKTHVRIVTI